jgi:RTX calcium-binding nonapeptide repeat (4 copies)
VAVNNNVLSIEKTVTYQHYKQQTDPPFLLVPDGDPYTLIFSGSGVLISPYFYLTAAHVLDTLAERRDIFFDQLKSYSYTTVAGFVPGASADLPQVTYDGSGVSPVNLTRGWVQGQADQDSKDIAAVQVSGFGNLKGEATAFYMDTPVDLLGASASIVGYGGPGDGIPPQSEVETSIVEVTSDGNLFTETGPGHGGSGGPIFAEVGPNHEKAVVGIVTKFAGIWTEGVYLKYSNLDAIRAALDQAEQAIDPNDLPTRYIFGSSQDKDETIKGTHSRDVIEGGLGDDTIYATSGNDDIDGAGGYNTVHYDVVPTTGPRLFSNVVATLQIDPNPKSGSKAGLLTTVAFDDQWGRSTQTLRNVEDVILTDQSNKVIVTSSVRSAANASPTTIDLNATHLDSGDTVDFSQFDGNVYLSSSHPSGSRPHATELYGNREFSSDLGVGVTNFNTPLTATAATASCWAGRVTILSFSVTGVMIGSMVGLAMISQFTPNHLTRIRSLLPWPTGSMPARRMIRSSRSQTM